MSSLESRQICLLSKRILKMKIGIIGAGIVGQTFAGKLATNGHDVVIGIRKVNDDELSKARNWAPSLNDWLKTTKGKIKVGTFAEAAKHGEIVFNVTSGGVSIDALNMAGAANLNGKILIDVANPLDFSRGMPPSLYPNLSNTWSLGEEIQKHFPDVKVVKAFNTVGSATMIDPSTIKEAHDLFISGNDEAAKATVTKLAGDEFGWKNFVDLGDIVGSRSQEALLHIWVRFWQLKGTGNFNLHVAS
jgi:8-hydroxy-5-deazaflavin:NADPH oxidoreductase